MNRKLIYTALIIIFLGGTAFFVFNGNNKVQNKTNAFYPLKERRGQMAQAPEWATLKEKANKLIRIVRETPEDKQSMLGLATLYIQEGRATGDFTYYNEAALHYVNEVLVAEPANFEALILKSVLELSAHHFAEGLEIARQAKNINPYNAYVYGLMADGNIEMGNYKEAIDNLDKMISIRPDLRSYSRISYIREIHGETAGAIEAMKQAVEAGLPGDEGTEWARVQLAQLYENSGDLKSAEMNYTIALEQRPGYAHAIGGLANIAMAKKDYAKAILLYTEADALLNDFTFKEKLTKAYWLSGQTDKGNEVLNTAIKKLDDAVKAGEKSEGHHADRELASLYIMKKEFGKAVYHARAEYSRRTKNIDVNQAVAWAFYKNGEAVKALPYLTEGLATNTKNPAVLCQAGLIYNATGDKAKAKQFLEAGLKANPNIDAMLMEESRTVLKAL